MSADIQKTVTEEILQHKLFSLQLDESVDVAGIPQLMVFARYISGKDIKEEFLFCDQLHTTTRGEDIFRVVDTHLKELKLEWENCIGCCTDGARSMTGCKSGFVAHVRKVVPNVKVTHCIIHREALASKALQQDLGEVLDVVVRVVNLIKKRPLQSRLFRELCKEMGAEHEHLLFHCEVRWLSKGKVLQRVWELREQVMAYLKNENANLVKHFEDKRWLARFAYLVDIFNKLNMLNTSLQGKENSILDLEDGIQGFQARLGLWHSQLVAGELAMFPVLTE
ncbi:hypothetical protein KUCAC02_009002 [Chaenocephalus aceratus]|uniref:Uncharacterized protein n=1 Tax=Chaenocephalus aceratus TaxID=36190 RepID=A0ACB9WTY9_CHAAC|nr:hypothetical protein KUCAC02_009002 [Chaenocephalus aceratus]